MVNYITLVENAVLTALIWFVIASPALAMQEWYGTNQCELVAKDFQNEFGGTLVFIQPLKENGAYDFCDYCAHWMNKKYISGNEKEFFFDWQSQKIFSSQTEIKDWWFESTGQKAEIFELDRGNPPFAMNWHY
jgi:hypothetical protein